MSLPARFGMWIAIACVAGLIAAGGLLLVAINAGGPAAEALASGPVLGAIIGLGVAAFVVAGGLLWLIAFQRVARTAAALAAETQMVAEIGGDTAINPKRFAWLASVAHAVSLLGARFAAAQRETERAIATATERSEEQKRRLEAILRDLSEGVLVCNLEHQILLYNQVALSLLHVAGDLGLGRSLFNVLGAEPILHALDRLTLPTGSDRRSAEVAVPVVCATRDARSLLHGRVSLIVDAAEQPTGYVLTLTDVTRDIAELGRRDALLRQASEGLRAPLANLRAAVETIATFSDMESTERRQFEEVIRREADELSTRLEALDYDYRGLSAGDWPMADIHSTDLFKCVMRRLTDSGGPQLTMVGLPLWLSGDSHSLVLLIERLAHELARAIGAKAFDIEALLGDKRIYVELRWDGEPVAPAELDRWLAQPLPGALGAQTLREVLSRHRSEIWSRSERHGRALLRVPLPTATRVAFDRPRFDVPARPEFYDFDLLRSATGGRSGLTRPLRSFTFVVFDTETTGLAPSQGDEIVAIAAVRVVNGRILTGETFARLVNPGRPIPAASTRFHGVTDKMVTDAPPIRVVLPQFRQFAGDSVLVAHNAAFDLKFLKLKEGEAGVSFDNLALDTLLISAFLYQDLEDHDLDAIARRIGIEVAGRHSAMGDAMATAAIFVRQLDLLEARGITTLEALIKASNIMLEIRARQAHF